MLKKNKKISKKHELQASKMLQTAYQIHQSGNLKEAEECYKSIIKKFPNYPNAICMLGVVTHQSGNSELAINYFEKALTIKKDFVEAHYNLGNALCFLGEFEKSIQHFEQVIKRNPTFPEAYNNLGNVYKELGQQEKAVEYYEKAISVRPDYIEAYNNLGITLVELGRQSDAVSMYESAIRLKPNYAEAYHNLSIVKPDQKYIPEIQKLLDRTGTSDEEAMRYHFALGNIYYNDNDYKNSFEHFRDANQLNRKKITYSAHEHSAYIDKLINIYTKKYFQEIREFGSGSEIPVFIIGMPRSGTTLLEQVLSTHPDIYGAGELAFFTHLEKNIEDETIGSVSYPECMVSCSNSVIKDYSEKYINELENVIGSNRFVIDKMPDNFLRLGLIKTLFPKSRIIHCKRNVFDVCTSIYINYFTEGAMEYAYDMQEIGKYCSDYIRLMKHWHDVFESDIYEIEYEELVTEQEKVTRHLIEFLGLEWNEKCLNFHENKRSVKTASNVQVRRPIYKSSIDNWKKYDQYLEPLIDILKAVA